MNETDPKPAVADATALAAQFMQLVLQQSNMALMLLGKPLQMSETETP